VQNSLCVPQVLRSPIGSVTAQQSSSGREPNFAALSTGRPQYSAGQPSRSALAHILVVTGSIARSAKRRCLSYSKADFEVSRPAGATRCTDWGEIFGPLHHAKFQLHRCNYKDIGPPKLKCLLRIDQNVEYKRPAGAYPLAIFTKFAKIVPRFRLC